MKRIERTPEFIVDLVKCKNIYGLYGINELNKVVLILQKGHKLNPEYRDHLLDRYKEFKGKGYRDCHIITISNDWVLIYRPDKFKVVLVRTGQHRDLFKY